MNLPDMLYDEGSNNMALANEAKTSEVTRYTKYIDEEILTRSLQEIE